MMYCFRLLTNLTILILLCGCQLKKGADVLEEILSSSVSEVNLVNEDHDLYTADRTFFYVLKNKSSSNHVLWEHVNSGNYAKADEHDESYFQRRLVSKLGEQYLKEDYELFVSERILESVSSKNSVAIYIFVNKSKVGLPVFLEVLEF